MTNWADFFSLSNLLAFFAGMASVKIYTLVRDKFKDRLRPQDAPHVTRFRTQWIAYILIAASVVFVAVKEQDTHNLTLTCQAEFNAAIRARSDLAAEDKRLDGVERDALYTFVNSLLNPPPDIKALPPGDPVGRNYGLAITTTYLNTVSDARTQRAKNDAVRAQHPLPEVSCGR